MSWNNELRKEIVDLVKRSGEGHIPSSFSIVDIIDVLYGHILNLTPETTESSKRDYFVLSKGHGCAGLFVVLEKYGYITKQDLEYYSTSKGILGGHPDCTKVPSVEASTGSLGHGMLTALGVALGLKIKAMPNKVFCLVGDGECHEGTIWEGANVAANMNLGNFCVIVDWNQSAAQLMPKDDLTGKWRAFGWDVHEIDGHSTNELKSKLKKIRHSSGDVPQAVVAHTVKGKGVSFIEGHGRWHHRVPSEDEMIAIRAELEA